MRLDLVDAIILSQTLTNPSINAHPEGMPVATVGELFQLQEIDTIRQAAKRRLLEIQSLLTETAEISQARQALEESQADLRTWQAGQKDAELESLSSKAKIEENDRRLMGGAIHNPKELEALQSNGESLRRHRAVVDERAVEALLHVEELTGQVQEREAAFNHLRSAWAREQQALINEGKRLQQQYAQTKTQRDAHVTRVDKTSLAAYEALRKRKTGVAVARIVGDSCGACFVRLPTGIIGSTRNSTHTAGTSPTLCPSCGRILYAG